MSEELRFNTKIDLWLLIVALGIVALCLWLLIERWPANGSDGILLTGLWVVLLGLGIVIPLWILTSVRYFLSAETLRIRCGPMQLRVPLADIESIKPTNSLWASPALSLERLRIEYGEGRAVMISPEPREEFLRQIEFRRRQLS